MRKLWPMLMPGYWLAAHDVTRIRLANLAREWERLDAEWFS